MTTPHGHTLRRARRVALALAGLLLAACSQHDAPSQAPVRLAASDGSMHAPMLASTTAVTVVVFVSHECPIANAIAPTLHDLAERFAAPAGVHFFVVHVDPDLQPVAAAAHAQDYALPGTVLLDPQHQLASLLHVRRTPEAFVLRDQKVLYRGAIDDQWHALGSRSQSASRHFLADAITAVLARERVAVADTEPVGCLLPEPRRH